MESCPSEDAIADLAAGQLSPDAGARLQHHLRDCDGCRLAFAAFAQSLPEGSGPQADDGDGGLQAGQRFGQFELIEKLGVGSMGAVWSAQDTELDRVVALKTLRPVEGAADDDAALQRLKREAQAMAALSHPNVVTVYQVVVDGGRVFLAMDLVTGGTLRDWLAEEDRGLDEILGAFELAGRGLAAAHAAGLVHRDFKPDNVLVSEDPAGGPPRVRVTDFGLARLSGAPGPSPGSPVSPGGALRLTRSGALVGTPAYMAPEQLRGAPIDSRADLFAFCTALHEAVYGTRPFGGRSLADLRRQTEANEVAAAPPGNDVPGWLRQILLKGLRAAPSERWASMDELLAAIAARRAGGLRRAILPWVVAGAIAAALAAILIQQRVAKVSAGHPRPSLAVLPPRNASDRPEAAWLSVALADLLSAELADGEQLRVVPGRTVALVLADQKLDAGRDAGPAEVRGLRSALGADFLLGGSYAAPASGPLAVELRLYDAKTGSLEETFAESGDATRPAEVVARASARLRQKLRLSRLDAAGGPTSSFPQAVEAERLLSEGVARMHAFDPAGALKLLAAADAIAPDNARILAAQADAFLDLGDVVKAREAGKRAFAAAGSLGREQRLRLERIMSAPIASDWRRAVEISRALFTFFPDDLEYGLRLAHDLAIGHQHQESFAVLEQLRKLPPPAGVDAGIDKEEAFTAYDAGDMKRARTAAARSAELGRERHSRRTVAHGRYIEASALRALGDVKEALPAFNEALALFRELGERRMVANNVQTLGFYAADRGDLKGALPLFEEVVTTHHELGSAVGEAVGLRNLGMLLRRMHEPDQALAALGRARALALQTGQEGVAGDVAHTTATILADQGRLAEAAAAFEEAAAVRRKLKAGNLAATLDSLADLGRLRGEAPKTRALCEEIRAVAGPEKRFQAMALDCFAHLELAIGHPQEAEPLAAQAVALHETLQELDNAAALQAQRGLALLALGRTAEAAQASAAAQATLAKSQNVIARAQVGTAAARIEAAQPGRLPAAVAALRQVLSEAEKTGSIEDRFEARLALGELLARSGKAEGRQVLRELQRDAETAGYLREARASAALLRR